MLKSSLIFIFILWSVVFSQDGLKIHIDEHGISSLPADIIYFEINISEKNTDATEAFNTHKSKVKILSDILDSMNLPDSVVYYSLFRISKPHSRADREKTYRTDQNVNLVLSGYDDYNQLQIKLLTNGFDDFSASFKSSNSDYGFELALINSMNNVRNQLDILIKDLKKNSYTITQIGIKRKSSQLLEVFEFFSANRKTLRTLENIPQTVHFEVEIEVDAQIQ